LCSLRLGIPSSGKSSTRSTKHASSNPLMALQYAVVIPPSTARRQSRQSGCTLLGCTSCAPGRDHHCRICGAINQHFTSQCLSGATQYAVAVPPSLSGSRHGCTLHGCTSCAPGRDHRCRNCGAINQHFTYQCPRSPIPTSANIGTVAISRAVGVGYSVDGTHTGPFTSATMTVFYRSSSGTVRILVALRGCPYKKDTFVTTGGSKDPGETPEECSRRECEEEFGCRVASSQIFHEQRTRTFSNFFAFIDNFNPRMVKGPSSRHEWEITPSDFSAIRSLNRVQDIWKSRTTGTALIFSVPLEELMSSPLLSSSCMAPVAFHIRKMLTDPSLAQYLL
jgi:8-oxo-dGTP pyrophosphatase MutT (NUDIX family)